MIQIKLLSNCFWKESVSLNHQMPLLFVAQLHVAKLNSLILFYEFWQVLMWMTKVIWSRDSTSLKCLQFFFLSSMPSKSSSSSLSLSSKNSAAHCLGNQPRILFLTLSLIAFSSFFLPFFPLIEFSISASSFSPNSQCFRHLVTFTKSPTANGIRDSSVRGGWMHTLNPCDQSGIQLPDTFETIR